MDSKYDRTYFESGFAAGVSCYTNYSWMPEFTIPLAHRLVRRLNIDVGARVLDYGCAKGYLVHALRLLDVDAYGCDVSRYALSESMPAARPYLCQSSGPAIPFDLGFSWVLAKDVLEHLTAEELGVFLRDARAKADNLFVVVPLGKDGRYIAPQYEMDKTHVLREGLSWWGEQISLAGWNEVGMSTDVKGIKDSWAHYSGANGVLFAR